MNLKEPFLQTQENNVFVLAPIPVWKETYNDDILIKHLFDLGLNMLNPAQRLMGQELPDQYDGERQAIMENLVTQKTEWSEETELNPIGSRFYTPPNNFLDINDNGVKFLKEFIRSTFHVFMNKIGETHNRNSVITESWIQYYEPTAGRGHNQHNHCRWQPHEEPRIGYAGGFYLSDGEPLVDHPYSGAFCFHLRGKTHFIKPHKGLLMFWPHDIVHSVKPFYGKSQRCVINFNIQIP